MEIDEQNWTLDIGLSLFFPFNVGSKVSFRKDFCKVTGIYIEGNVLKTRFSNSFSKGAKKVFVFSESLKMYLLTNFKIYGHW